MGDKKRGNRRVLQGVVASDKMDKTVVVKVTRRFKHPLYKKYVLRVNSYKAHDERNDCNIGDKVAIVESRPYSKDKNWRVKAIIEKAQM